MTKLRLRVLVFGLATACVCLLISIRISERIQQDKRNQALIEAVKRESRRETSTALADGADPNSRDEYNKPATFTESLKTLFGVYTTKPKTAPTALMLAIKAVDAYDISEILIHQGANINADTETGETALTLLSEYWNGHSPEDQKLLRLLVQSGAKVNSVLHDGTSILMRAAATNDDEDVAFLLNNGAKIDMQDHEGWTALMYAAQPGGIESLRVLLAHGARVDIKDKRGRTALMIAKQYAREANIHELLPHIKQ